MWDRPSAGLLGFLFFGWAIYSIENDIPDIEVYFIPTYLVLALAASVGFGLALAEAEHFLGSFPRISRGVALGVLSVAMVSLPLLGVSDTYASNDRSNEYRGRGRECRAKLHCPASQERAVVHGTGRETEAGSHASGPLLA
jgi:hypothetical protein